MKNLIAILFIAAVFTAYFQLGVTKEASSASRIDFPSDPLHIPTETINFNYIRMVTCFAQGGESYYGTAFYIDDHRLLTASHVTQERRCIDAETLTPLATIYENEARDFAILRSPEKSDGWLRYSCRGFEVGKNYDAIGYAGGSRLLLNRMTATNVQTGKDYLLAGKKQEGLWYLRGNIFAGMSGGPILNQDGVVIGINTATTNRGMDLSRALRDTILCRKPSD